MGAITGPGTLTPSSAPLTSMSRFVGELREVVAPLLPSLSRKWNVLLCTFISLKLNYLGFAFSPLDTVPGDGKGSRRGGELNSKTQRPVPASAQQTSPDRETDSCDGTFFLSLYPIACTRCLGVLSHQQGMISKTFLYMVFHVNPFSCRVSPSLS